MKTSVLSKYFAWFAICCTVALSGCNGDFGITESNEAPDGSIVYHVNMTPGKTYEFEAKVTDPEGDPLTYAWSVEESLNPNRRGWVQGELHSNTGRVVSYTAPLAGEIVEEETWVEARPESYFLPEEGSWLEVTLKVSDGNSEATWSVRYYWRKYLYWSTESF